MPTRDQLVNSIVTRIADYMSNEIQPIDAAGVQRGLEQFEDVSFSLVSGSKPHRKPSRLRARSRSFDVVADDLHSSGELSFATASRNNPAGCSERLVSKMQAPHAKTTIADHLFWRCDYA